MEKRTILLGDYDTATNLWTLAAWDFQAPEVEENLVNVPGRTKGPLDLSTALTDGVPTYGARELTITLESSEGDRANRQARISHLLNYLHGRRMDIVLPDHPERYATGRVRVQQLYNDPAHAAVQVTATCEPWLYFKTERSRSYTATGTTATATLGNAGPMPVVPLVEVTGTSVNLVYGSYSWALSAGSYRLPDLVLMSGPNPISYSGAGTIKFTYREAVLW